MAFICEVKNRLEIASSAASSAPHLFYGCLQGIPFFAFWIVFYAYPDVSQTYPHCNLRFSGRGVLCFSSSAGLTECLGITEQTTILWHSAMF